MNNPKVEQTLSEEAMDTISKVKEVDDEVGDRIAELPESLIIHLSKMFRSPKLLTIALLGILHEDEIKLIAMKYRIPERWAQRASIACLRALRRRQVSLWKPKQKQKQS